MTPEDIQKLANITEVNARITRLNARIAGMIAVNTERGRNGYALAYDDASFCEVIEDEKCTEAEIINKLRE